MRLTTLDTTASDLRMWVLKGKTMKRRSITILGGKYELKLTKDRF